MAYRTGFFDAIDGDRTYGAADMSHYYEGLISDGVLEKFDRGCKVIANNDMTVSITPGKAYINGRYIHIDSNEVLTVEQASSSLNRIDAIVLRLDNSQAVRNIIPTVKKGEPATNPVAPAIENTTTVKEICLATVYVKALATSFTDSSITDTRGITSICGFVTGLITHVNAEDLFLQWQKKFDEFFCTLDQWSIAKKTGFDTWFTTLTDQLNVNTYVEQYKNKFTTETNTYSFEIGVPEYEPGDIVDIYINNLHLNSDEYTLSSGAIALTLGITSGQDVEVVVTKSKIGYQVKSQDI